MAVEMGRRRVMAGMALGGAFLLGGCPPPQTIGSRALIATVESVHRRIGGRMGVALHDRKGRILFGYRPHDMFAMCSTFKASLAAFVLDRVTAGELTLTEELSWTPEDLVSYHPAIEAVGGSGRLPVTDLMDASVQLSDNVATNLLLRRVGGPEALTQFYRDAGVWGTRLDRYEVELNENAPDDPRDTSSAASMGLLMTRLLFGDLLSEDNRSRLLVMMEGAKTGKNRIRAGTPAGWRVGNKTGTGFPDAMAVNDIAWLQSPDGDSYFLSAYLDRPDTDYDGASAAIAEVTRVVLHQFA